MDRTEKDGITLNMFMGPARTLAEKRNIQRRPPKPKVKGISNGITQVISADHMQDTNSTFKCENWSNRETQELTDKKFSQQAHK